MDNLVLASAIPALLCLVLIVVVIFQLRGLKRSIEELRTAERKPSATQRSFYEAITTQLEKIEDQIGRFDIVFSDVQDLLSAVRTQKTPSGAANPAAGAAAGPVRAAQPEQSKAPPPAPPSAASPSAAAGNREPFAATAPSAAYDGTDPFAASPAPAPEADREPAEGSEELQKLVEQYRELITQPRKNEINRWCDEAGGQPQEITEDGTLQPLSRDEGGLLVLLSVDGRTGVVVPGGRLVVDFATSFGNVMAMRRVTRHHFELLNDGTGVLRLMEPALARRTHGGGWQITRPGKLAGLTSE